MIERCSDRQRKCDGLEKWPFHLFVESLPILLQIALLLLSCGLSRYMWSVNTSVARVVTSFTTLGILFYIGIVVAGTSSYECPFQTPVSIALRGIQASAKTRISLGCLSPLKVYPPIHSAWESTRKALSRGGCRIRDTVVNPPSWGIFLSNIVSGVRSTSRRAGHQAIVLLLRADGAFQNTKRILVQRIQRCKSAMPLPVSTDRTNRQPRSPTRRNGLLVSVRNLPAIRNRNAGNARCVCWIVR